MAIFGFKDKDGIINMCVSGKVTQEPKIKTGSSGKQKVSISVAYHNKTYINVEAFADNKVGALMACLEKGDVIEAKGVHQSWEYNGKTYEVLQADFLAVMMEPPAEAQAAAEMPERRTETASAPRAAEAPVDVEYSPYEEVDAELPF